MGSVLLLKCSLCRVLQLLDVVDRGELADGGLGSVVGVVIDHDLTALDLLLDLSRNFVNAFIIVCSCRNGNIQIVKNLIIF